MIPQLIEKRVIDAIRNALAGVAIDISPADAPAAPSPRGAGQALLPIQIFGTWQPATVGFIKNQEEASSIATVAVAVGTQSRSTFSTCEVAFRGSVVLRIRAERDVTGTALLALSEPLENLFRAWQGETYQKAFTDLDVDGFQCGDIAVTGSVPAIDFAAKLITLSWTFTLNGVDS